MHKYVSNECNSNKSNKCNKYKSNKSPVCKDCNIKYNKLNTEYCRLCYMIHNLKPYYINELILCYSKYDQITIIKKTVEFILKHKRVPSPDEIDSQVKLVDLPLYKYNNKENHKIFTTNLFNFSYIIKTYFGHGFNDIYNNKCSNEYLFDNKLLELNNKNN